MRFDDIPLDTPVEVGSYTFTEEAILAFARLYDPQPFHTDGEAAAASHFGALCASGWHTAAAWMRLTVDHARATGTLAGISPGIDEILWKRPVYVGDTIRYSNTVRTRRRLASRPGWAMIGNEALGLNQRGEEVYRMRGPVMVPIED
ncbi:MaoC family dehydratase [Chthonobacter rhizosphaerae]|uniref:MaoC family dehydratase n=1 Tax=Chthonobacter rhizosphaerae TaxID=2735553 RepID=UPI0015EECCD2|nr:MaoC family dehydratase [Chthonobacter rhizosphaerae]